MYNDGLSSWGRENLPLERSASPAPEPEMNGKARIKVIGVGGAGNNAINRMIDAGITSAEYVAVNTDAQILACNKAENKIQIGARLTKGLGAGADPEIGRAAAEEDKDVLVKAVEKTDLLFITAGMGGGTGTGAAPVIAKIAKDLKILTVAVVTEPFSFEGKHRMDNTTKGLDNLRKYVDTLIIIPNEKIGDVVPKNAPMSEALRVADEVLKQGIRGIADLIVTPALINLDFADVKAILKDRGLAHMGVGVAKGENRIVEAVRLAVNCPLLETTIEGATGVILNIVGGNDLTYDEVRLAANLIHSVVDYSANIIFGACIDENIRDEVEVTVIATGFSASRDGKPAARNTTAQSRPSVPYYNYGQNQPAQTPNPSAPRPTSIPPQPFAPYGGKPSYQGDPSAQGRTIPPRQTPSPQPYSPAQPSPQARPYAQPQYQPSQQDFRGPQYQPPQQPQYQPPQPQGDYRPQPQYQQPQQPQQFRPSQPYQNGAEGYFRQEYPQPAPEAPRGEVELDDDDEDFGSANQKLPDFVRRLIGKKKQ